MEQHKNNPNDDALCITSIHSLSDTYCSDSNNLESVLSEPSTASGNVSKEEHIAIDVDADATKKTSSNNVFSEFCYETTAHGFSHAANEKGWTFMRFMWIIIIMGSMFLTVVHFFYLFSDGYIDLKLDNPTFPGVTLCQGSPISPTGYWTEIKYINTSFLSMYAFVDDIVAHYTGNDTFSTNTDKTYIINRLASMRGLFENLDYEYIESIGYSIHNMVVDCVYRGETCNLTNDFVMHRTSDFFNCYTFKPQQHLSVEPGINNGLSLILFLENNKFSFDSYPFFKSVTPTAQYNGILLEVHARETLPNVKISGRNIMPGTNSDIKIKENKHQIDSRMRYLCSKRDRLKYLTDYGYSIDRCIDICKAHYIFSQCGCVSSDIPVSDFLIKNNASYCGKIHAFTENEIPVLAQRILCERNAKKAFSPSHCDSCTTTLCSFKKYSVSMVQSAWPQDDSLLSALSAVNESSNSVAQRYFIPYLSNETEVISEVVRSNLLRVNIDFESYCAELRELEFDDVDIAELLANVGGILGLWFGK